MLLLDSALAARHEAGNPVRVAMVGAGFMGRGIALQIVQHVPGMKLSVIANRNLEGARQAYAEAGVEQPRVVRSLEALEAAIESGAPAITDDALLVCQAGGIDAVVEVTGTIEFAASVVLEAIDNAKHIILMNAELDATIGPLLKSYADKAHVVYTNVDGDQPGVILNLYRFVKGIGVRPVLCGNIKGLQDRYRNPTTQESFARQWKQKATMVTSFADGSKISFEQAIVANATGMKVGQRGMFGPTVATGTPITEATDWYPRELLIDGPGLVDYVVGASPSPGVFVLGLEKNPIQQHYLNLYKLGPGPLYCFYTPYHLCHLEVPNTVARAVLFGDAAIAPLGHPVVDVIATAKIDLEPGCSLDGIGGYALYGQCENADVVRREGLLPLGLAEGCRLLRAVPRDQVLTYDDVDLPTERFCDDLRRRQNAWHRESSPKPAVAAPKGLAAQQEQSIRRRG
jgi:predicted homoserine dehydrogenase-like protein